MRTHSPLASRLFPLRYFRSGEPFVGDDGCLGTVESEDPGQGDRVFAWVETVPASGRRRLLSLSGNTLVTAICPAQSRRIHWRRWLHVSRKGGETCR